VDVVAVLPDWENKSGGHCHLQASLYWPIGAIDPGVKVGICWGLV